jgi:hypothetical protein
MGQVRGGPIGSKSALLVRGVQVQTVAEPRARRGLAGPHPGAVLRAGAQRSDWLEVGRIDRSVQDTEYRYILNYRLITLITQGSVN